MHVEAPVAEKVPAWQVEHDEAAELDILPAAQDVQASLLASLCFPASQASHVLAPELDDLPATHATHSLALVFDHVPPSHLVHALLAGSE